MHVSFDFKEPWNTHRSYQVFRDRHSEIFGRPECTSHRIVMCQLIMDGIDKASKDLKNRLFAKYRLTGFFMMYVMRLMIEDDPIGEELLHSPEKFVHSVKHRAAFLECMNKLADQIVIDLNYSLDDLGDDFDYRDKLRDEIWVKKLAAEYRSTLLKLIRQKRAETIKSWWDAAIK
jgi:hypothetical protein